MNEIKIVIEGLNELTEAVKTLVSAVSGGTVQTGTQQIPVQATPASGMQTAPVPVATSQQTYGQMLVQQAPAAMQRLRRQSRKGSRKCSGDIFHRCAESRCMTVTG